MINFLHRIPLGSAFNRSHRERVGKVELRFGHSAPVVFFNGEFRRESALLKLA